MKAAIKIPKGWRRIVGRHYVKGDRYFSASNMMWAPMPDELLGSCFPAMITIRRIARPKKWVPKGYVEVTFDEWKNDECRHLNFYAYSIKGTRKKLTYVQVLSTKGKRWMDVCFWLRRGAK